MKSVWYLNNNFVVPKGYKYIAADPTGDVYAYPKEPSWSDDDMLYVGDNPMYLGNVKAPQAKYEMEKI